MVRFTKLPIMTSCLIAALSVASMNCFVSLNADAKPMPAPSLQEAHGAQWIVRAQYVDYVKPVFEPADVKDKNQTPKIVSFIKSTEFDYFDPPHAEYRVQEILKSSAGENRQMKVGDLVRVPFHFHDLSACLTPEKWKF